jgi:hypothetical protein
MAWTAPRTWVAGETVTAALFNTHVRDNLLTLTQWAAGSFVLGYYNTIGGGSWSVLSGNLKLNRYLVAGKLFLWQVYIDGSTVTGAPTGLVLHIPGTSVLTSIYQFGATAQVYDGAVRDCYVSVYSTSEVQIVQKTGAAFAASAVQTVAFQFICEVA